MDKEGDRTVVDERGCPGGYTSEGTLDYIKIRGKSRRGASKGQSFAHVCRRWVLTRCGHWNLKRKIWTAQQE